MLFETGRDDRLSACVGGHAGRWGRCVLLVVLVWVWRVGAGATDGDAGTVKRGGMYERIRKMKGHTFPESLGA